MAALKPWVTPEEEIKYWKNLLPEMKFYPTNLASGYAQGDTRKQSGAFPRRRVLDLISRNS